MQHGSTICRFLHISWIPDHEWFCHVWPIKSTVSQTPHQHKNQDQHLCIAPWLSPFCFMALKLRSGTLADRRRLDVSNMRCQRRLLRVFWQQHISIRSIHERTKQPTASYLIGQRRLRWFENLHRMPSSLPVRMIYGFNPNNHGWKRPIGRPTTR